MLLYCISLYIYTIWKCNVFYKFMYVIIIVFEYCYHNYFRICEKLLAFIWNDSKILITDFK